MKTFIAKKPFIAEAPSKVMRVSKGVKVPVQQKAIKKPVVTKADQLQGKMVKAEQDGTVMAKVTAKLSSDTVMVKLAIPDRTGVMFLTDSEVPMHVSQLDEVNPADVREAKFRLFEDRIGWDLDEKMVTIREEETNRVKDYYDVEIEGYGSTYKEVTPEDRDGDYIMRGAFDETLARFKQNPVMLIDHVNSVEKLVGSYTKVGVNDMGLALRGKLSNAPEVRRVRFLVAEGHLKSFSIGGMFRYAPDGRGIEKIELWETSLVAVPANPDAMFLTRSLDMEDVAKLWKPESNNLRKWVG